MKHDNNIISHNNYLRKTRGGGGCDRAERCLNNSSTIVNGTAVIVGSALPYQLSKDNKVIETFLKPKNNNISVKKKITKH